MLTSPVSSINPAVSGVPGRWPALWGCGHAVLTRALFDVRHTDLPSLRAFGQRPARADRCFRVGAGAQKGRFQSAHGGRQPGR
jgi:hypothetical protein